MSRKKFMESYGATNRNARYGWAFVNHEKKEVYFGAWDVNTNGNRALILSMAWEFNNEGRRVNAFGEALEYIKLVENEGYSLRTFPIIWDEGNDGYADTGSVHISTNDIVLPAEAEKWPHKMTGFSYHYISKLIP